LYELNIVLLLSIFYWNGKPIRKISQKITLSITILLGTFSEIKCIKIIGHVTLWNIVVYGFEKIIMIETIKEKKTKIKTIQDCLIINLENRSLYTEYTFFFFICLTDRRRDCLKNTAPHLLTAAIIYLCIKFINYTEFNCD